ncbi:hypothetical protein WICPIJ_000042 [Wickerhamomyces pijperi]|uniref:Uncharacterized protein n=1 Tax=Wickerhamomyces pijperi TaxID=599730 RepID=A0A9P8TR74_WICPI|nr:hypothetical protein WICPIJ_000042 [Wickerhamomyces pijperi]
MARTHRTKSSIDNSTCPPRSTFEKAVHLDCVFDHEQELTFFRQKTPRLYFFNCKSFLKSDSSIWFRNFKENVFPSVIKQNVEVTFDTMMFKVVVHKHESFCGIPISKDASFNMYVMKEESVSYNELSDTVRQLVVQLMDIKDNDEFKTFTPDRFPDEIRQNLVLPGNEELHQFVNTRDPNRRKVVRFFPFMEYGQTPQLQREHWLAILTCFNDFLIETRDHRTGIISLKEDKYFQKMCFFSVPKCWNTKINNFGRRFTDNFILIKKECRKYLQQSFVDLMYRQHRESGEGFALNYYIDTKIHHPGAVMYDPKDEVIDLPKPRKQRPRMLIVEEEKKEKVVAAVPEPELVPVVIKPVIFSLKKPQAVKCHDNLHDRDPFVKQLKLI